MDSPLPQRESEPPHTFRTGRLLMRPSPVVEFPTGIARACRVEARRPVETPRSRAAIAGLDESGPSAAIALDDDDDDMRITVEPRPRMPIVNKIIRTSHASKAAARRDRRFATGGTPRVRGAHLASALLVIAGFAAAGIVVGIGLRHAAVGDAHPTELAATLSAQSTRSIVAAASLHDDVPPQPASQASPSVAASDPLRAASALPPPPIPADKLQPPPPPGQIPPPGAQVAQAQVPAAVQARGHSLAAAQAKAQARTQAQAHAAAQAQAQFRAQAQARAQAHAQATKHGAPAKGAQAKAKSGGK